ncbi:coenzyme A pyrophosphatase [Xaviernesmea oryzae]|uniref:Coenzyme A pyrophosphatase n=1 Tax=Xaviernesmea oryzae TaxID=464029 RepID=A0A1Q9AVF4_9HYPH|nr:CoA pyrophosphatase [Xaviernesmea oryzae]OLP59394.1 coenzyme A pyrophosphatase [Xaviernesmea oryzae]SEL61806.1 8-oxo-dGTP pyrophosphatase MutT, NUDIX family [Xaviernesmea oryzae]
MSTPFSAEDFRARATRQSGSPIDMAWREHGDMLINPSIVPVLETMTLKDAAVLVGVVDGGPLDGRVILTQRTANLRKHSGQIAFPGGAVDHTDASIEEAALREAEEEIGLARHFVEPAGRLPHYRALSGFRITPVLATIKPGFTLKRNPAEVDQVFDVPLSFLMNPVNHRRGSRDWNGEKRHFYEMPFEGRNIWGITAGILRMLYERLYA